MRSETPSASSFFSIRPRPEYIRKAGVKKKNAIIMQTPLTEKEGYGLALLKTTKLIDSIEMTGHTGSAYGLSSAMFFNREKKFGLVVISSGSKPGYTDGYNNVIKKIVNILYDNLIKMDW